MGGASPAAVVVLVAVLGDPTGRDRGSNPAPATPAHHAALCHLSRPQAKILSMMEDNKQLALRIDGAVQSASQEVTNLRAELTATNRRLAELSSGGGPGPGPGPGATAAAAGSASAAAVESAAAANMENQQGKGDDRCAPGRRRFGPAAPRAACTRPPGSKRLRRALPASALWLATLLPLLGPCKHAVRTPKHKSPSAWCSCSGSHGPAGSQHAAFGVSS